MRRHWCSIVWSLGAFRMLVVLLNKINKLSNIYHNLREAFADPFPVDLCFHIPDQPILITRILPFK